MLIFLCVFFAIDSLGQISQNPDRAIVDVAKLCCFQLENGDKTNDSNIWMIDSLQFVYGGDNCPLKVYCSEYYSPFDSYVFFTNIDSTELLIGTQAPGMNNGDIGSLIVVPMDGNYSAHLLLSQCVHTNLSHFVTDGGVRLGMSLNELWEKKGDKYRTIEVDYLSYTYISPIAKEDPDMYAYCVEHGEGDVFLDVVIENGIVVFYALLWSI